jgi:O-antigen/teichoic acid export membrane protein
MAKHAAIIVGTIWNLSGQILPLVAALVCIPHLVTGLGIERFGLLTLVWTFIGYFTLFDLGLGRALTQLISRRLGGDQEEEIPHICRLAQRIMLGMGITGGLFLALSATFVVRKILHVPQHLDEEASYAFILLAIGIPAVVATSGLAGILSAYQRFDLINYLRIPLGIFNFAAPLAVLHFSNSLVSVTSVLLVGRLLNWAAHIILCRKLIRNCPKSEQRPSGLLQMLLGFGGWMTVTNIVGPLMVYFDRFLIGSLISVAAVAYYTTPYEVATKLWLISGAFVGVLFPAFSQGAGDRHSNGRLLANSMKWIALVIHPLAFTIIIFSREGLTMWLGPEFASNSYVVLNWLAFGVLINCIGQVPFAFLQALGYPNITAKLHLLELPIYATLLWLTLPDWGVMAAAIAWTARVTVDAAALIVISTRYSSEARLEIIKSAVLVSCLLIPCVGLLVYVPSLSTRVGIFSVAMLCYLFGIWKFCYKDARKLFLKFYSSLP